MIADPDLIYDFLWGHDNPVKLPKYPIQFVCQKGKRALRSAYFCTCDFESSTIGEYRGSLYGIVRSP
ncbi:hypothetical protein ACRALDRAFT_210661 [Sodiomyces alcalophilus JCM 7366]|uniref:uncharacterized protein n=1 Tax=Sodiomyces alcalophilus JCM 7366 TaxID=591952 RepID=UPI0039B5A0BA